MRRLMIVLALCSLACVGSALVPTPTPAVVLSTPMRTGEAARGADAVHEEVVEPARVLFVCDTDWLHVRSAPMGKVISALSEFERVTVYEVRDGWARIGERRWVRDRWLCSEEK